MGKELESLSDDALRDALISLRHREHALTVEVVRHLGELETRELFAKDGYSSLFCYCTQKLGYSESGANRRIRAARAVKNFSFAGSLLSSGEINLSTLSAIAGYLNAENHESLLRQIIGRTQREVDQIVALLNAKPAPIRETVRAVAIKKSAPGKAESDLFSLRSYIGPDGHRCGCKRNLEVDHIRPWAKGGSNTTDNLRLLCRRHNQLEAKRHFPKSVPSKQK